MTNPFMPNRPSGSFAAADSFVRVVEQIPVAGQTDLSPQSIAAEKIPSPTHLVLNKALARGAMGHVHPATDRNTVAKSLTRAGVNGGEAFAGTS